MATDEYQFQIDYYYRDPQNDQRDAFPRYRSEGSTFVITNKFRPTQNVIWQQISDQGLMLYGNLGDISGIELIQDGKAVARLPVTSHDKPDSWFVDLSNKPSGRYSFRFLRGYSLLEDKSFKLGVTAAKGSRIDKVTTNLSQELLFNPVNLTSAVTTSWNGIPAMVNNLHQELIVTNSECPKGHHPMEPFANYFSETTCSDLPVTEKGQTKAKFQQVMQGAYGADQRISLTIARNRLYSIDSAGKQWTVAQTVNPLANISSFTPTYLYVNTSGTTPLPHAICEQDATQKIVKRIALEQWINNSLRCPGDFADANATYNLISLQSSVPDPVCKGELLIHTAQPGKQLAVKEIALKNVSTWKIQADYFPNIQGFSQRYAIDFRWKLPDFLENNLVKVNFQLAFHSVALKAAYGDYYRFEYILGNSHHTAYNGHLLPVATFLQPKPQFADFDINQLSMYVQYQNAWIPLMDSSTFIKDGQLETKPFVTKTHLSIKTPNFSYEGDIVANKYQQKGGCRFEDSYTLLFYPVPEGIDEKSIVIEYYDSSLRVPDWRQLPNLTYSGQTISAPANAIQPGAYKFRLQAKNTQAKSIDFSSLCEKTENDWAYGTFKVTHGASLTTVKSSPVYEVIQPSSTQEHDRWDNVLKITNPSGHSMLTVYNGKNMPLKKTDPAIEITHENGTKEVKSPETFFIYDKNTKEVAVKDPNGNITRHERDKDGTVLKTTLADGNFKQFKLDIFGRTQIIRDPLGHEISLEYDRCNREVSRVDACQWKTVFAYNELGDRISVTNGNNEKDRFDYLHPCRQVTHHYLPDGDNYLTVTSYDRHGVTVKEEQTGKRQITWELDAFGNVRKHTDLGGAVYTHTLNPHYPTEVMLTTSTNGAHGQRLSSGGVLSPMPNQDLVYQYDEASHLIGILDNALPLTTLYRYDQEGRRARETFIGSDGHIHQAVLMKWNALGGVVEVQDTIMKVNYSFDANENRRSTIAAVYWNGTWNPFGDVNWYTYTATNSMKINRGTMVNGVIGIAPNRGTELVYDIAGRREFEITIKEDGTRVKKQLSYLDNDLLSKIHNTLGNFSEFKYDKAVSRQKEYITKTSKLSLEYKKNGWVSWEGFADYEKKISTATGFDLNDQGLPKVQYTSLRSTESKDGYDDTITSTYVSYDNDKVSEVNASRRRLDGGETKSKVRTGYDPNGNIETIISDGQETRSFLSNSSSRIVKKKLGSDKHEFYFYTTSGQPLGRFGNIPPEGIKKELTHADFDLNYHPVGERYPQRAPGSHMVVADDNFSKISERVYGDDSFASLIAEANGYRKEDIPPVGMVLHIPNLVNTNIHNWKGQYPVYNPAEIVGSLYPHMRVPEKHIQRRTPVQFWHIFIETMVATAILAFAPELAGVLSGILGELLGSALAFAVAGAASNLAQQELALGLGDQKGLSVTAIGQSALLSMGTMGGSRILGIDLLTSPSYKQLLEQAVKNITLTLATQGLSFATGQQRHFDWRVLLASLANSLANVGTTQIQTNNQYFNDLVATASATIASIGIDGALGRDIEFEAIAANTLGTFIGNQLAAQAKAQYNNYQMEKEQKAYFEETQIPSIRDQLAEMDQDFFHSIVYKPFPSGPSSKPSAPSTFAAGAVAAASASISSPTPRPKAEKTPPQDHLKTERAREEAVLNRAARWNNESIQQPKASQSGFWSLVEKAGNSKVVRIINTVGDAINPFITIPHDVKKTRDAYRAGDRAGMGWAIGELALDTLGIIPLDAAASTAVKLARKTASLVGSKPGVFQIQTHVAEKLGQRVTSNIGVSDTAVLWFGKDIAMKFYTPSVRNKTPTLGVKGRALFHMMIEDAAYINTPLKAAVETGFAPSVLDAYRRGGEVCGLAFPTKGYNIRLPVKADAMGWPHFLEGGHTAIKIEGTPFFLVNKTREFVLPGGSPIPKGSVLFELDQAGTWRSLVRY